MMAAFLGGVSFRLTCNSATTKKRSEFASCWFQHDLPMLDRFFFPFYLLSFSSLAFSMEELESLIVIIIIRVSCANSGLIITCSTWRKRKNLKKSLSEARVAKKSKSSDTVTAGSGSVGVDEEFEDCMLVAGGSPRSCGRPFMARSHAYRLALTVHSHVNTHASYEQ